jgi:uncharacterized membrane protein (DUF485 family)
MQQSTIDKIKADPAYQDLVSKRSSFAVKLSVTMLVVYFAFILTIAFNPSALGTPLSSDSVTTVGIPIGMFVIVFAFVLTGIYVKRANSEFDDLSNKVKENIERGES